MISKEEAFSFDFLKQVRSEIDGLDADSIFRDYSVTFPDGMGKVPVLELCGVFEKETSFEDKVRVARYCMLNKRVVIAYDGEVLETVLMNDYNADFDAFKVFSDYPFALMFLIQTCFVAKLKNSIPPSKNISATMAE